MLAPTAVRPKTVDHALRAAIAASIVVLGSGCGAPGVRPVVGVGPVPASYEVVERGGVGAAPERADEAVVRPSAPSLESLLRLPGAAPAPPKRPFETGPPRPVQLDPTRGPVDLGLPVLLDMGAQDVPYDDGVEPIHVDEFGRPGFSSTVIRLSWREPVDEAVSLVGGAAFLRFQDIGLLDGIADARFGFAVLGIQVRL